MDRYQPKQRKVRYQLEPELNEREERVTASFTDLVRRVRERQETDRLAGEDGPATTNFLHAAQQCALGYMLEIMKADSEAATNEKVGQAEN